MQLSYSVSRRISLTVKALLSPQGAYLILDTLEGDVKERRLIRERGGLLEREGGLFTKSTEKNVHDSSLASLGHTLRIEHTIFQVKHKFNPFFS